MENTIDIPFWNHVKDCLYHDMLMKRVIRQIVWIYDMPHWEEITQAFRYGDFITPTRYRWAWIEFYYSPRKIKNKKSIPFLE